MLSASPGAAVVPPAQEGLVGGGQTGLNWGTHAPKKGGGSCAKAASAPLGCGARVWMLRLRHPSRTLREAKSSAAPSSLIKALGPGNWVAAPAGGGADPESPSAGRDPADQERK